jgi:hypothetical protein
MRHPSSWRLAVLVGVLVVSVAGRAVHARGVGLQEEQAAAPAPPGKVAPGEVAREIRRRVEAALPDTVGDRERVARLLHPEVVAPRLGGALPIDRIGRALGDRLRPVRCERCDPLLGAGDGQVELFRGEGGSVLRWDRLRGRVDYLNPGRRFKPAAGDENRVTHEAARSTASRVLEAVGVPRPEVAPAEGRARDAILVARDAAGKEPTRVWRAEVHVRYHRAVAGTPVYLSRFHAAVDRRGEVARLHASWPDFSLCSGLSARDTMSRNAVIAAVTHRLARSYADPRNLGQVAVTVAYVRAGDFGGSVAGTGGPLADAADAEGAPGVRLAEPSCFAPALVVRAIPVAQPEDSGEVSPPIQELVQPLLAAPE